MKTNGIEHEDENNCSINSLIKDKKIISLLSQKQKPKMALKIGTSN